MNSIRNKLKDDFAGKVKKLNEITEVLVAKEDRHRIKLSTVIIYFIAALGFMIAGYFLFSFLKF